MLRYFRRKLLSFLCVLLLIAALKQMFAAPLRAVGHWISGDSVQAFSAVWDSLSDADGLQDAVEVFREALQN